VFRRRPDPLLWVCLGRIATADFAAIRGEMSSFGFVGDPNGKFYTKPVSRLK
jgi:hypothetical protein